MRICNLVKESISAWIDDFAPSMGAALAYYTLFSIAPLLLIVIAIAGVAFGVEAARNELVGQLEGLIGREGAIAIQGLLKSASEPAEGALATLIGAVTLLVGATTVFGELQSALDRIWEVPRTEKKSGLWSLLRQRLLSFGLILVLGLLMLVSLVLSAALAALGRWWGGLFNSWEILLQAVNFAVSFAVVTGLFAAIYKLMPRAKISWHDVWIGAVVTALLFTVGKFLIGLYLGKSGVTSGFGAAGSLVVLLIWVYYSAQIFLLGAEFTWVYAHAHGSRFDSPSVRATSEGTLPGEAVSPGRAARPAGQPAVPEARERFAPNPVSPAVRHAIAKLAVALVAGYLARRFLPPRARQLLLPLISLRGRRI